MIIIFAATLECVLLLVIFIFMMMMMLMLMCVAHLLLGDFFSHDLCVAVYF